MVPKLEEKKKEKRTLTRAKELRLLQAIIPAYYINYTSDSKFSLEATILKFYLTIIARYLITDNL